MPKKNKSWSLEDKLAILKENLVEGKSVADICEAKGLSPSLFYTWREALFKPSVSSDEKHVLIYLKSPQFLLVGESNLK